MPRPIVMKSVSGKFKLGLQYQAPDLEADETITDVEVTISPTGLTAEGGPEIDGNTVSQVISGGVIKKNYTVLFKVTTSAGFIYNNPEKESILVKVIF